MRTLILATAAACVLAQASPVVAQTRDVVVASQPGAVGVAQTIEVTATITAIDTATRMLTLKGPKGNEFRVIAGPEVKNFAQLKVGDSVQAQYVEALALELKKGGGLPVARTEQSGVVSAKPGEKPAAAGARQIKIVGNVTKVDAATQTVTVKGPERTIDLKVRNPDQFKLIAVGDQIEATYTDALAVAVTAAAKPAD